MAGKRAAKIAVSLVLELPERLAAAEVTGEYAPILDEALDAVWPLAKQLARLEKAGKRAGKSARRAREAVLRAAVASCVAAQAPRWAEFDVRQWHTELVPGPDPEHVREAA